MSTPATVLCDPRTWTNGCVCVCVCCCVRYPQVVVLLHAAAMGLLGTGVVAPTAATRLFGQIRALVEASHTKVRLSWNQQSQPV
eukprot:4640487-Amphidinium_carterae.1